MNPQEKMKRIHKILAECEHEKDAVARIFEKAQIDYFPHMERIRQLKDELTEIGKEEEAF